MKKLSLNFLFPTILLVILIITFSNTVSIVPPLGKLLNPSIGFVQNEKAEVYNDLISSACIENVSVYYDDRKVPHIFAKNDHDLYLAQGYVTAKDRLWQMDFISYVAAGRLSEIFGIDYLDYDRQQRRMLILQSAQNALRFIEKNEKTKKALNAFTKGVNEYISSLSYVDFPFEYKLMDYQPERWTNLKSVLVMKYVAVMLSGYEEDISMTKTLQALGGEQFRKVFPEYAPIQNLNNKTLDINDLPYKEYINYGFLTNKGKIESSSYNPRFGSNNWALNGSKTKSGHPILCNDPHLSLSLPSIWYEIQLHSPDMNVYGVSIPGTLGVIIGYNENIAWGVTNGATDARDWYKLKIRGDYEAYEFNNKWRPLRYHTEHIRIKNQDDYIDTFFLSLHGPIVKDDNFESSSETKNFALKWTLHEPSNELLTFLELNKASNYKQFKEAIKHYQCPIQNFVFASVTDTIAIHHQGKIYRKWNGQGRFLMDGTKSEHLYHSELSFEEKPFAVNPVKGYVFSANNFPVFTNKKLSYYLNGNYTEDRASQIEKILASKKKFTVTDMKKMQLSNKHIVANKVLPVLLKKIKKENRKKSIYKQLEKWNYTFSKDSYAATFFEQWFRKIELLTWDELNTQDFFLRNPDHGVIVNLICDEPNSDYFDIITTDKKENLWDIVNICFKETIRNSTYKKWESRNRISIDHLSQLAPLGVQQLKSAGNPDVINAISQNWGPSWRMIVELGKRPRGYGIFVGGQSGNPGSKNYMSFVNTWRKGQYFELAFFLSEIEAKKVCKKQLLIIKSK